MSKLQKPLAGRRFLLLQGPTSPFFLHLGRALRRLGADVERVGFNAGDRLYWRRDAGPYVAYRDRLDRFADVLGHKLAADGVTDVVMLGDGRAYHAAAMQALRGSRLGATPWIVEHGYLRPHLLVVEPWGHGGRSGIPAAFDALDRALPEAAETPTVADSFVRYSVYDVAYHVARLTLGPVAYPNYRAHGIDGIWSEWRGWSGKLATTFRRRRDAEATLARVAAHEGPRFLIPLQLDTDFQLRHHGTGRPQVEDLAAVVASFAAHAAPEALLVVKEHPRDNGLRRWAARTRHLAAAAGIADRVAFLPAGRVEDMFADLAGVVTINSTVGLSALLAGVPVRVLGRAIYERAGLTHQGDLASFWRAPAKPDPDCAERFRRFLRHDYHVPGAFDGPAAVSGAENVARLIAEGRTG